MGIFHAFVDDGPDDPNEDIVRPSDERADHFSPSHLVNVWLEASNPNGDIWVNMPAAATRLFGDPRTLMIADLRWATQARIVCEMITGGASGAEVRAQYSLDNVVWEYLDGDEGPGVPIVAPGMTYSEWGPVVEAARVDPVYLRFAGINGNGSIDPKFRSVWLYVR